MEEVVSSLSHHQPLFAQRQRPKGFLKVESSSLFYSRKCSEQMAKRKLSVLTLKGQFNDKTVSKHMSYGLKRSKLKSKLHHLLSE